MADLSEFYESIRGKKIALVGLGISNTPLIDMLVSHGARLAARDKKAYSDFDSDFISALEHRGIELHLGDGYLDGFDEDIIIKAPGIRRDAPGLVKAVERGALLTSEMELFFKYSDCRKIAVTGSDGKTTTTTLIYLMLREHYKNDKSRNVFVGGNIGKPLFAECEKIGRRDTAVLELSSFQLHAMEVSPDISVITNISPNHLDWHTDYGEYINSKKRIFEFMHGGRAVLNAGCGLCARLAADVPAGTEIRYFSSSGKDSIPDNCTCVYLNGGEIFCHDAESGRDFPLMRTDDILIPGAHNIENYMTAAAALYGDVDPDVFARVARTFKGVEHRIELVREFDGVKYYNSSIDSSPSRTVAALNSFGGKKVIAVMGGYDKHIPYDVIGEPVCRLTKAVVLTGATSNKIKEAILSCGEYADGMPVIVEKDDFKDAVIAAKNLSESGDTVILTPASASFDKFKNFEERGKYFKEIVLGF